MAEKLHKEWICLLGAPGQIHTDQAQDFESRLFQQLCRVFKMEKTRTTAYHPSSNGQVEHYNATMANMLNALTVDDRLEWDLKLPYACYAYNSTRHDTTGIEPHRIMLGRLPNMPWDITTPAQPGDEPAPQNEYVRNVQRRMRYIHQLAREKAGRAATLIKKYNDRRTNWHQYKIGDLVSLRSYKINPGTRKLEDKWMAPYRVIDVLDDLTYRVAQNAKSKPLVVHHD